MQRVPPQLGQRRALQIQRLVFVQHTRQLGLTTRHQHHVLGLFLQTESNRIVCGRVASVKRGDHIDLRGQGLAVRRLGHTEIEKLHALKTQALRQRGGGSHQLAAGFYAVNMAATQCLEKQVVNDEA